VLAVLDQLLVKTQVTQFALLPSYWLSAGLIHWSEGAVTGASIFGLVLLSYTLFFGCLCFTQTGRAFYEAGSRVRSRSGLFWRWTWLREWRSQKAGEIGSLGGLERGIDWMSRWLPTDVRALLVKDGRLFWRDTTQWGQTLVLFGLLAVYILNLRHFSHQLVNPFWIHLVSHLNLGACALNLATLTTRFIYPQFSLEGKRIWIVGMAPVGLKRVIWVKYGLASVASLGLTLGLIILSGWMLEMSLDPYWLFHGGDDADDLHFERAGCRVGCALPQLPGGASREDCQRVWRHLLPRAQLRLHRRLRGVARGGVPLELGGWTNSAWIDVGCVGWDGRHFGATGLAAAAHGIASGGPA
jgi:hypothetical protein